MGLPAYKPENFGSRPERWECDVDVVVNDDCGRELTGKLANISDGGFMAEISLMRPAHKLAAQKEV